MQAAIMTDPPHVPNRDSLSIFSLSNSLLRNQRILFGIPLVMLVLALGFTLLGGVTYVSESKFTPHTSGSNSTGLAAFAAQFGFSAGLTQAEPPIDFYAELLRSQEFLGEVAQAHFKLDESFHGFEPFEGSLVAYYRVSGETEQERLRKAVEALGKNISIRRDVRANLVIVQVQARRPDLAEQINRRLLDSVDTFNLEKRQSQASAEREFVEERMKEALDELNKAEDALMTFYEQNLFYDNSPTLRMEASRLQRRVDQHQQVYLSLTQAYEQARIDEVRDTPVITIVDKPEGWVRQERGLIKNGIIGLLFGCIMSIGIIFGKEFMAGQRQDNPEEYAEFNRLLPGILTRKNRDS